MVTGQLKSYLSVVRFLLYVVVIVSGATAVYFTYKIYTRWQNLLGSTKTALQHKAYEQVSQLDKLLTIIANQAQMASRQLSSGSTVDLEQLLKQLWDTSPLIGSTGVAYAHSVYNKPYSLLVTKKEIGAHAEFVMHTIETYYDYTQQEWYKNALAGIVQWSEPFIEVTSNHYVVRYAVPISRFNPATATREPIGVLFIDLSHAHFADTISKMTEALRGYSFILSENGDLITYPIEEDVEEYKTLFNISRLPGKKGLRDVVQAINKTRAGITNYYDTGSQEAFWVSFAPLSAARWYILLFSAQENFLFEETIRYHLLYCLIFFVICFLSIYVLLWGLGGTLTRWWIFSYLAGICFLGLTAFHLYMFYYSSFQLVGQTPIRSRVELVRFEQFQNRLNEQLKKPPITYIPTGVSINHLLLESANVVDVSGVVWQKYSMNSKLARSIALENAEEITLIPLYKEKNGDVETIGWSFRAKLKVKFDKLQYPFDAQTINMTFFHPNFSENVILVPDFVAYDAAQIGRFIGLSKNFHLVEDWILKDSYYYYHSIEKVTNFGLSNAVRKESFPDLNFAIVVTRNIVNPMVAYALPLIIIAIILFYILLESSAVNLQISTTIGQISGLFLATVLAHQTFRRALDINVIVYLESFYFLMYFLTIIIASNCMLYIMQTKGDLLSVIRTSVAKYIYWPILGLCIFLITLYFFR